MSIINRAAKELIIKIVYCGPPLSGKTTNLVQLHANTEGEKGKFVSISTSSDRTLYFDINPQANIVAGRFKPVFHIYTVPGPVIYNATLQLVLRGVDGIVFVADSQVDKMGENIDSFRKMEENLRAIKLDLANIPFVLQFNKQDLTTSVRTPTEYLEQTLNRGAVKVPSFTSIATRCEGVLETFSAIKGILLEKFSRLTPNGLGL